MSSAAKRRGAKFEQDVVDYLREHGFPDAERRVMGGANDRGDIAGVRGWTLEVKATQRFDVGEAMTEAHKEARNAGCVDYAVIRKRRMRGTDEAYVVLPLRSFAHWIRECGRE